MLPQSPLVAGDAASACSGCGKRLVQYEFHEAKAGQLANNPSGLARAEPGASCLMATITSVHVATMSHRAAANSGERLKNLANFCDMNAAGYNLLILLWSRYLDQH